MANPISSDLPNFSKQLIKETVQGVIKVLAKDNPFSQLVFNTPQAAQYLNTSPSFLTRLRAKGKGPPYIQIESAIRYRRTDIDAWLSQQVIQPANDSQPFLEPPQCSPHMLETEE